MDSRTELIDNFLASWRSDSEVAYEPNQNIFNGFLEGYQKYLESIAGELIENASKLSDPFDSLRMGGEALHLSTTFREEQVSDWLKWVLTLSPISNLDAKCKILKELFSQILKAGEYKDFCGDEKTIEITEIKIEREVRTSQGPDSPRLDLVLHLGKTTIVIEIKIGDLDLEKNMTSYKDEVNNRKWPNIVPILIIPENDLNKFKKTCNMNDEEDEEKEENVEDILEAFPPIKWETFLHHLRCIISSWEGKLKNKDEWITWKVLTNAFISFVEANVLGFDMDSIKSMIESKKYNDICEIESLARYLEYRGVRT